MKIINFEFKAICNNLDKAEKKLLQLQPKFEGLDHQIDTYFNVTDGRLKLREGNIENALIHYIRNNTASAKQSSVLLYQHEPSTALKDILTKVHGIKVVVDKQRKIYFIDNVKFHFDNVKGLGTYLEVEAIDTTGKIAISQLQEQCAYYQDYLGVEQNDLVDQSYSDLLLHLVDKK